MSGREGRGVMMLSMPVIVCGTFLYVFFCGFCYTYIRLYRYILDYFRVVLSMGVGRAPQNIRAIGWDSFDAEGSRSVSAYAICGNLIKLSLSILDFQFLPFSCSLLVSHGFAMNIWMCWVGHGPNKGHYFTAQAF